jgi:hypothetical protein
VQIVVEERPIPGFLILPCNGDWDHDYQLERIGDSDFWGASDSVHAACPHAAVLCEWMRWPATLIERLLGKRRGVETLGKSSDLSSITCYQYLRKMHDRRYPTATPLHCPGLRVSTSRW